MPLTFLKIALLFILSFNLSFSAQAFTLNNSAAIVFAQDEVVVNVAAGNCNNIGIDENELISIVGDAVNQYWNKAPTSRLKLRQGVIQSLGSINYAGAEICNTGTSCDPNPALAVASGILITCNHNTTTFSNPEILAVSVPNNISGKTIIGSLIMINDRSDNQFKTKSRDEKISVIAHEIGHTFGLGHSPVKDSLMYYSTVSMRKSLGSDDIDGISYLYPKQQPVSCGSIDQNPMNKPNYWLGLFIGFTIIALINKFQSRYLKLRERF